MKIKEGNRTLVGCTIMGGSGIGYAILGVVSWILTGDMTFGFSVFTGGFMVALAYAIYGFSQRFRHSMYAGGDINKSRLAGMRHYVNQ